jgi:hypothetical protein
MGYDVFTQLGFNILHSVKNLCPGGWVVLLVALMWIYPKSMA